MNDLVAEVARVLQDKHMRLITAESCTGGLIAAHLTGMPGSSDWFEGAFVTYRAAAKIRMLGVRPDTIEKHSVVSEPVAREMAVGALEHSGAHISVAVTGVAGPTGGDIIAPVGTVWFAWALREPQPGCVQASEHRLDGDREAIRERAVQIALSGVLSILG